MTVSETLWVAGILFGCLAALATLTRREKSWARPKKKVTSSVLGASAGWFVLVAIAARSFAWSAGQEIFFPSEFAVGLGLAAATGKAGAGFLADRMGRGNVVIGTLVMAAGLFVVADETPWSWFPAVAMLQASTGPMLAMVMETWPHRPALASGLAQGLAIALGGVPLMAIGFRAAMPLWVTIAAMGGASVLMGYLALRSRRVGLVD